MVLDNEFPPDNRVEKEAFSLIMAGHEVHLACYARKKDFIKEELYHGIHIHRIYISAIMYKMSAAVLILPFYFRFWKRFLLRLYWKYKFSAFHIHDLPLAKTGYYFKKNFQTLLICDQHEYYSNWIVHTAHYNTLPGKIIKLFSPWKHYEREYLNKADLVITVTEPLRTIYIHEIQIPAHKILSIPNTPMQSVFNQNNIDKDIIRKYEDSFVIFYAGGMDILRGIDTAFAALPDIIKSIPNVKLLLVGKTIKPFDPAELAEIYKVKAYVEYIPQQPIQKLPSYISASDVCFFTPPTNRKEIQNTIATKIFQYVAMGKPVIVSNARMMADFVMENKLGFVIEPGDKEAFAKAVITFYRDSKLASVIRKRAFAIAGNYYWEKTVTPLTRFYSTIPADR